MDLFGLGLRVATRLWWFTAFCLLSFAFSQWSTWTRESPPPAEPIYIAVFAVIPAAILFGLWLFFVLFSSIVVVWQNSAMPGMLGRHLYEIREEGLFESTSATDTLIRWSAIRRINRHRRYIHIPLSRVHYHIIPLRAFPDEASAHTFFCEVQLRIARTAEA